ncbi:MAG: GerMN domain-containing protein [Microthrixaceae bacterium]
MLAVLAVTAGLGCGVPVDEEASITPSEDVPYDLLSPTTTAVAAGSVQGGETTICLSLDGALLTLGRARDGDPPLRTLDALLAAAPTAGESEVGLRSALDDDDVLDGVSLQDGTAVVRLGEGFTELPADQQLVAVAQATCTLTSQPGVLRVSFELGGSQVDVPVQGGELVSRPVTRADYARLIAS